MCWDNLIGIKQTCEADVPESGLYIQDLPYLDLKAMNAAVETEMSAIDLIRGKINYSVNQLKADLNSRLAPKFKAKTVLQNAVNGFYRQDMTVVESAAGTLKGIEIRIDNYPYLALHISKVKLYIAAGGARSIYIFNTITGQLLDTLSITTVANEITELPVNKTYSCDGQRLRLFVCYDADVDTWATALYNNPTYWAGCYDTCLCDGQYAWVRSASVAEDDSKTDLQAAPNTAGLSVTYTLQCDMETYLCSIRHLLAWPLLHLAGSNLCKEIMYNKRLNSITTVDAKKVEALAADFYTEYKVSMDDLTQNLHIPKDICFECWQAVKSKVNIP